MKAVAGPQYYQASVDTAMAKAKQGQASKAALNRSLGYGDAVRAEQIARQHPAISPELFAAVVQSKMPVESLATPGFAELERRDAAANDKNWVGIEGLFRGAFLGAESLYQSSIRNQRILVNLFQGDGLRESFADSGTTYLDEMIKQTRQGEPINIGSGFIPRSTPAHDFPGYNKAFLEGMSGGLPVAEAHERATQLMYDQHGMPLTQVVDEINESAAQLHWTLADGTHVSTPYSAGRLLAGQFTPPDTALFQLLSTPIDGFLRIFADPIDKPIGMWIAHRRSLTRLSPSSADPMFVEAWDDFLERHNVQVGQHGMDQDILYPHHQAAEGVAVRPYEVDELFGEGGNLPHQFSQDPEKVSPIILDRGNMDDGFTMITDSSVDPASIPLDKPVTMPDGSLAPGTFDNYWLGSGIDPSDADMPAWQYGKQISPYSQAYVDMGVTAGEVRETIYLRGGRQAYEDFVLEHELVHAELQLQEPVIREALLIERNAISDTLDAKLGMGGADNVAYWQGVYDDLVAQIDAVEDTRQRPLLTRPGLEDGDRHVGPAEVNAASKETRDLKKTQATRDAELPSSDDAAPRQRVPGPLNPQGPYDPDDVEQMLRVAREELAHYKRTLERAKEARAVADELGLGSRTPEELQQRHVEILDELERTAYEAEVEAEKIAYQRLLENKMSATKWREKAYREAGISRWWRPWVKTRSLNDMLQTTRGQRIIAYTAKTNSYTQIDNLYPNVPTKVKVALTESNDPATVIEVFMNYGGTPAMKKLPQPNRRQRIATSSLADTKVGELAGWASDFRFFSKVAQNTRRWVAESGDGVLDPHQIDHSVTQAKNWLRTIGATPEETDRLLLQLAKSEGSFEAVAKTWDDMRRVFVRRLDELGYNGREIGLILEDFHQQNIMARLYFDNLAGENVNLYRQGLYRTRDGTEMQMLSGHLPSEFSHGFIIMPSMREVRRATNGMRSQIQKIRRFFPEGHKWSIAIRDPLGLRPNMATKLLDPASSLWRNSALLRVGWPARVIPEEGIRQLAAGYSEMIMHPFSYLALVFSDTKGAMSLTGDNLIDDIFTAKALGAAAFDVTWDNTIRGTPFDAHNVSWGIAVHGTREYNIGLTREILDIATTEVGRRVAADGVDETLAWLRDLAGDGPQKLREVISKSDELSVWRAAAWPKGSDKAAVAEANRVLKSILQSIDARITKNTGGHYHAREISGATSMPTGRWVDDYGMPLPIDKYDNMTLNQLRDLARQRGIERQSYLRRKDELIDALLRDDGYGHILDAGADDFFVITKPGDGKAREFIKTGVHDDTLQLSDEMDIADIRNLEERIQEVFDSADNLPEVVKVPSENRTRNLAGIYDGVTDAFFYNLMSRWSTDLIRSPFARIRYSDEMALVYLWSTPSTRAEILKFMDDNGMRAIFNDHVRKHLDEANLRGLPNTVDPETVLRKTLGPDGEDVAFIGGTWDDQATMGDVVTPKRKPPISGGFSSWKEVDRLVQAIVVEDTKELFYDLAKRQNWADMSRLIFPFADAWWEVISRWAKFLDPTGLVPGRQLGAQGMAMRNSRKAEVIINGGIESGFFSEDKYGNEVFNWPGWGLFAGNEGGVQMTSQTSLESLMFVDPTVRGIIGPGTGPMGQVAGRFVIPKLPASLRGLLNEAVYGEFDPEYVENPLDIAQGFFPTWVRRAFEWGFPNYRQVNADMVVGLYSSTYLSNNPMWGDGGQVSSQERMRWAQEQGSQLAFLRILDGIFSPAQPRYEPAVWIDTVNSGGEWVQRQALADEFRAAREYYGDSIAASMYMLETFGIDTLDLMPLSRGIVPRPTTEGSHRFLEEHDHLLEAAPYTLMAWIPDFENDSFSWEAYQAQFFVETGLGFAPRQRLTPKVVEQMHSEAKGFRAWDNVKAQYDKELEMARSLMTPAALSAYREQLDAWRIDQRNQISTRFWGWERGIAGKVEAPKYRALFDEMSKLGLDPQMQELNPQLTDWIRFTTDLWNEAVNISMRRGVNADWWRESTGASGEAEEVRKWFLEGLDVKRSEMTDPVARAGADWYSERVIAPLLNGALWDDVLWFEADPAPSAQSFTPEQMDRFAQLPGNVMPQMPQYAGQGVNR